MYGTNAWTLTKTLKSKLDGTYARMLKAIPNISWRQYTAKLPLYRPIPNIFTIFHEHRMCFVVCCL